MSRFSDSRSQVVAAVRFLGSFYWVLPNLVSISEVS